MSNHAILAQFCKDHHVGLVVVGPEVPLAAGTWRPITSAPSSNSLRLIQFTASSGIADDLTAAGIPCFGPSAKAAELEASKSFSKAFMERHGIPTARYGSFTDPEEACNFIRTSVSTKLLFMWHKQSRFPVENAFLSSSMKHTSCTIIGNIIVNEVLSLRCFCALRS